MALNLTDALCGDSPDRADISELGLTAVNESVTSANDVGRYLRARTRYDTRGTLPEKRRAAISWRDRRSEKVAPGTR